MAELPHFGPSESPQIYHDENFDPQMTPMISHAPMPSVMKSHRRPLQASNPNVILNPPGASFSKQAPAKSHVRSSSSPLAPVKPSQGNGLHMVSFTPPVDQTPPTDSIQKRQPLMSRFQTASQKPGPDLAKGFGGRENAQPIIFPAPSTLNLSIESFYPKPNGKRLLEPAPITEAKSNKRVKVDDGPLPSHDSFPPIVDDGSKPSHSYAQLIGMAILRSPQRRLTLSQIYKWISDSFKFYAPDAGWQNSIRHNLSLNKAFFKVERPKDDPGKGNYWQIEPGLEHQFIRGGPIRKGTTGAENIPAMSSLLENSLPPILPLQEPVLPPQRLAPAESMPPSTIDQEPTTLPLEPSSDATIPISDSAPVSEEGPEKLAEPSLNTEPNLYSPLPAAMHSSPPIPRHMDTSSGSSPPAPRRNNGSSAIRSRKRKTASMDDSGYISSLESSVLRSNPNGRILTSEADRPRKIKRGRAEEEIARLRASSYDSPTKHRSGRSSHAPPLSSSPLRRGNAGNSTQMLPPLTPAVKLKAPPKPPPSVSPATNLRLHRESIADMINSPLRHVSNMSSDLFDVPATKFDESVYTIDEEWPYPMDPTNFNVWTDDDLPSVFSSVSPTKRSVKRLRLDRTQSAGLLGEAMSASRRSIVAPPMLKPGLSPALSLDTPSRFFDGLMSSPSRHLANISPSKGTGDFPPDESWMEDFFDPELAEGEECSGLDMLQGFAKIGAPIQGATARGPPPPKPVLGRSHTSII